VLQLIVGIEMPCEQGAHVVLAAEADVDRHLGCHSICASLQRIQIDGGLVEDQGDLSGITV
jgi:hypothetical protein